MTISSLSVLPLDGFTALSLMIGLLSILIASAIHRYFSSEVKLCSEWYCCEVANQYEQFRKILQIGDIVETKSKTGPFGEWAICVEGGKEPRVIHRYDTSCGRNKGMKEGQFCEETLLEFCSDCEIRINNARDKVSAPKKVEDIVRCTQEAVVSDGDGVFGEYDGNNNVGRDFVELARYPKEAVENRLGKSLCSSWYKVKDIDTFSWLLKNGDLVEFNRWLYSHWAVCMWSEPLVVAHRSGSDPREKWKGKIKCAPIGEAISGCWFRINNSLDKKHTPRSVEEIHAFVAESLDSEAFGRYNLILNNCKRYAQQARYGIHLRRNLGLVSERCSAEELRPQLVECDVVKYEKPKKRGMDIFGPNRKPRLTNWAIYVGTELDRSKPPQVAFRCLPTGPSSLVVAASLEDFFTQAGAGARFLIDNELDSEFTPLEVKDSVAAIKKAVGKKDPCECDLFGGTCPHYVLGARYGAKARGVLLRRFSAECPPSHLREFESECLKKGDRIKVLDHITPRAKYLGDGQVQVQNAAKGLGDGPEGGKTVPLVDFVRDRPFSRNNWDRSFFDFSTLDDVMEKFKQDTKRREEIRTLKLR